MNLIIDIPEDVLKRTVFYREFRDLNDCVTTIKALEKATPLDKIRAEIYEHFMTIDGGVHDKSAIKCMEIIDHYMKGE